MEDTYTNNLDKFKQYILDAGLKSPERIITDGQIHRFKQQGDDGTPCWYIYHDNLELSVAVFGCWKRGISEKWLSKSWDKLPEAQKNTQQEKINQMLEQAYSERKNLQKKAANACRKLWENASSASANHAYLSKKDVRPYNIKQEKSTLLIPLFNTQNELVNIQSIGLDGSKRFTKEAEKKGCFFKIGEQITAKIYIAEGYATGASIHEITEQTTIIAFDAHNILPVAENIKSLYPGVEIIIAADNDHKKDINLGLIKAQEAATQLNLSYTYPQFSDNDDGSDFNDLTKSQGKDETRKQLQEVYKTDTKSVWEATVERLSKLEAWEYDQVRNDEAKKLGVRITTLDNAVTQNKERFLLTESENFTFMNEEEAAEQHVYGDELADSIYDIFNKYLVASEENKIALTLWVVASYCIDAFRIFPKLCINSPQKRCGKTTCLDLLRCVTKKPLASANATPASIFRAIDLWKPTLLIDEADTFLRLNDELRGIINAGHTRSSAFVLRTEGEGNNREPKPFSVWAPMVIAMIGNPPSTIADRSIFIKLKRKTSEDVIQKIPQNIFNMAQQLRRNLIRWAADNMHQLPQISVKSSITDNDRASDNWEALTRVAILLGEKWEQKAYSACAKIAESQHDDSDDDDISIKLLEDTRTIFMDFNLTRVHSCGLVDKLLYLEESPWNTAASGKPIDQNWIAKKLKPYGIESSQLKLDGKNKRGFRIEDFLDAWQRYLPCASTEKPDLGATPATELNNKEKEGITQNNGGATTCYPLPQSIEKVAPQVLPAT